jgi:DNA-nicking Smr family endonuclease
MAKDLKQKGSGDNKKFAIRPFSAIKGITVEKAAAEAKPVVTSVSKQQPGSQAEDDLLFLTEMAGVTRIHRHAKAQQPAAREAVRGKPVAPVEPDESSLFLEALKELKLDVSFSDNLPEDDTPGPARKISRMRQLRRGSIRLNLEIDLHGLTRDEALDALASFIPAACRRGQQAVLVIAGKGAHSPGEPVLQGAVSDWLATKGGEWVAEFTLAPDTLGGEGAYVVFLKAGGRQ